MRGVERHDYEPAFAPEHAVELAKRERPVDEMAHEPHHGALEPAVAERQVLRPARLQPDRGGHVVGGDTQHLRLGVDAPHLRGGGLGERLAQATRAAAAVEHAPAAEVALAYHELEDLAPVVVDRTYAVVLRGEPSEVGRDHGRGSPRATHQRLNASVRTSGTRERGSTVSTA